MPLVNPAKHDGVMLLKLNAPPANTYSYEKFFCAGADIAMLEKADPYFKYDGRREE